MNKKIFTVKVNENERYKEQLNEFIKYLEKDQERSELEEIKQTKEKERKKEIIEEIQRANENAIFSLKLSICSLIASVIVLAFTIHKVIN